MAEVPQWRLEGDWFDVGHTEPRRAGRAFPAAHVEKALADLAFVAQVVTAPLASPGSPYPHDFTLLIFVGPRPAAEIEEKASEWEDLIREAARRRVGDEHVPDRIEIYALYARRGKKGAVDAHWARATHHRLHQHPHALACHLQRVVSLHARQGSPHQLRRQRQMSAVQVPRGAQHAPVRIQHLNVDTRCRELLLRRELE